MKTAIAKETTAKVSLKHSRVLCKAIKGKRLEKARKLMEDLIDERRNLKGKHYTKASKKFLDILKAAGANAKKKDMSQEKLFVKNAVADKGETTIRPRTRWHLRGRTAKSTNIKITVEER